MDELSALFAYIDSDETRADVVELETLLTAHKALDPENGGDGEAAKCEALLEYWRGKGWWGMASRARWNGMMRLMTEYQAANGLMWW